MSSWYFQSPWNVVVAHSPKGWATVADDMHMKHKPRDEQCPAPFTGPEQYQALCMCCYLPYQRASPKTLVQSW